jgi:hypothetical protein
MICRNRSVQDVHGLDGTVTESDQRRGFDADGLAGVGGLAWVFTPMTWKLASFAGEKSTTKHPGCEIVSSQVTVICAPAVSVF